MSTFRIIRGCSFEGWGSLRKIVILCHRLPCCLLILVLHFDIFVAFDDCDEDLVHLSKAYHCRIAPESREKILKHFREWLC